MNDKELKRLRRLLVFSWVLICILFLGLATLGSYQIAQLKSAIAGIPPVSIPGKKGDKGEDGLIKTESIVSYLPPLPGKDPTDEQVQKAVDNYFVAHPVKDGRDGKDGESIKGDSGDEGPQGEPGIPGRILFVRQSVIGLWECRYNGDTSWAPLVECQ